MIKFDSDYLEGAHPRILDALMRTNYEQTSGYGEDDYCIKAARLIRKECNASDADVHFLIGGTGTNTTVIAASLRPYQAVISAETGHINVHESGAIEGTGHKVIALEGEDGKVSADKLNEYCETYFSDPTREHMVKPSMLYISHPTEKGTLYKAEEIMSLREVCDRFGLFLYTDGARLGYALACEENDVTLPFLARVCDAFYIGGTKVGALFGEALVITNDKIKEDFRYMQKRQGSMLAKGRLLGIQFCEMFSDGLYYEMGKAGILSALKVRNIFEKAGFEFFCQSPTNQQFPILTDEQADKLSEDFSFEQWCRIDENRVCVRFCTSWATSDENIRALETAVLQLINN